MKHRVLLGLGASMGESETNIQMACALLEASPKSTLVKKSRLYRSTPLGRATALFVNQCCILRTGCSPIELLKRIQYIEKMVGRRKSRRWMDRVIDIDILLFDTLSFHESFLHIPHRELQYRSFVLQPAHEIAGSWIHPELNCRLDALEIPKPRSWSLAVC